MEGVQTNMIEAFLDNNPRVERMAYVTLGVVAGLWSRLNSVLIDRIAPRFVKDSVVFPYHPINSFVRAMEKFTGKKGKNKLQVLREEAFRDYLATLFPVFKGGQNG